MRRKIYDQVYAVIQSSIDLGIGNLTSDSRGFTSNKVNINQKQYVNFSLCDYLALSKDERIKEGAIKAIENYGVYTAVSKAFLKVKIYDDAEEYLSQIFNKPVLLFPRTTLAHMGVLPVITDTDDAIILDQQVHTSVRVAADLIKGYGNYVETIRHNRVDILEERINELKKKYKKVWYLVDSIYSMYGDIFPYQEMNRLLNEYEQFHIYIDDAHGMSWQGEHGKGFVLEHMQYHPRMVLMTSLGKGFGAGGGAAICYNEKIKDRLSKCSAPLIFTSPLDPPSLGAIVESAKIHLSDEIYIRQTELKSRIELFNITAKGLGLPIINDPNTSIAFVATGQPDMCREICFNLMENGFYTSPSHYPAVSLNNSGVRAVITLYQSEDDIRNLLLVLKEAYDNALQKRNLTVENILSHYKLNKQGQLV